MRRAVLVLLAGVACVLISGSAIAQDFPRFTNHVVDAAGVVPDDAEDRINAQLAAYQKRSTNQIAVAVVETLDDTSVEDYAEDLFDEWGVGQKDKDNGALLVIAMQERQLRIEVGYGLEGDLTDLESGRIVDAMAPLMRRGDIGGAIEQATNDIRFALGDTEAAQPAEPEAEPSEDSTSLFWVLPLLFFIGMGFIGRRRGRRRRDFSLWPILLGGAWGSGGSGGGFSGGGGGFGGGGGGGSGGGGASGGW